MKSYPLLEAIGDIRTDMIYEAENARAPSKKPWVISLVSVAACLALIAVFMFSAAPKCEVSMYGQIVGSTPLIVDSPSLISVHNESRQVPLSAPLSIALDIDGKTTVSVSDGSLEAYTNGELQYSGSSYKCSGLTQLLWLIPDASAEKSYTLSFSGSSPDVKLEFDNELNCWTIYK